MIPILAAPIHVIDMEQTCFACPSQWNGQTRDGRAVYVRYRWGHLSVELMIGAEWTTIYAASIGDTYDGFMDYDELRQRVPWWIHLPDADQ